VKLDRGLAARLREAPAPTFELMAGLIELGRAAGRDVVAEGIEGSAEAEVALVLGASHGQGPCLRASDASG
jgi:EAL domain-containing protein (putative c-di-GMP-specific phosphodiesterase class I)